MAGSDNEGSLKKDKKDKKDKDKDKDKKDKGKDKDKDEKKDKGKDKDKDEKKDKKDKDGGEKKDKDKKDKDKDKKDKDKDKKDKGKDEKDKGKDEKGKDKEKDKDKKEKKDKKDKKDEDEDEDEEDGKKKKKKDKDKDKAKDKDKKDKPPHPSGINVPSGPVHGGEAAGYYNPSGAPPQPHLPAQPSQTGEVPWFLREPGTEPVQGQGPPRTVPNFPNPNPQYTTFQQPPQQPSRAAGDCGGVQPLQKVPPSGYRIPLDPNTQFPSPDRLGRPPATDFNSSTGPIFIGSAIFPDAVHPCKIVPSLHPPCRVSYNGRELEHHGRFDLLPITQDMEWVPTGGGQIPPGRRPVEGGYESSGGKLYHALGSIQGVHVPGKAAEHIRGASIPFGGGEHILQENYSILCWK